MAYSFSRASTQYLQTGSAVITDARDNTLAALVYITEETPAGLLTILSIGDDGVTNSHIELIIDTARKLTLWTRTGIGGTTFFTSNLVVPINTWTSVGCWTIESVLSGSAYHDVYFWASTNTHMVTSNRRAPINLDNTCIGKNAASANDYFEGRVAEAAIWSGAFSYDYAADLADFIRPSSVNADNLLAYWPLVDDLLDDAGEYDMTAYNSPSNVAHPTMSDGGSGVLLLQHYHHSELHGGAHR